MTGTVMVVRRGDDPRPLPSETSLRVIMRGLREIMAEGGGGQEKLDRIVRQIAGVMVAEVCSIYLKRQDGSLELFATEGLNPSAVHKTRLKRGEGLVGRCSELAVTINEPEASSHPAFSYRPETSEEIYHSLLAVPISRSGQVLGVLVIQNRTPKEYSDEDVEVMQATAMVVAENLISGAVAGTGAAIEVSLSQPMAIEGEPLSEGIALGHIVLHEPRIVVTQLMAENPVAELDRLDLALKRLQANIDEMFEHEHLAAAGEHRDVLEAYRMFAHDKGWHRRLREAVEGGLTAEAAVERIQNAMRTRMLRQHDTYWKERQRDLDDLSDRLLRVLSGRLKSSEEGSGLPPDVILVARTMGPAELLDYDRSRLRGLVVEDGSSQSHVAVVAKALGIAAIGQAIGIVERVSAGDAAIIDAVTGEVHLRPTNELITAYSDKVRFRARRQKRYQALRDRPAVTKDGIRISLMMNAGLLVDMPHLAESGADGIGLYRTELQFMLSDSFPRLDRQTQLYRAVLEEAGGQAGRLSYARCRRRQDSPLSPAAEGRKPGDGLAGNPHVARPAGAVPPADARHAQSRGRVRAENHDPDGFGSLRTRRHPCLDRARKGVPAEARVSAAGQRAGRGDVRGAGATFRTRCISDAGGFRLGRFQRSDAIYVRRRPHQCARREPL